MYLTLFKTFFKLGIATFWGGYTMLSKIEDDVVRRHQWMSQQEFTDLLALVQTCPGVFFINMSTFIGYKIKKTRGAICTTLGAVLPSFLIILLIATLFHKLQNNPIIASIFAGIRPAIVALIAIPTFTLAKETHINLTNCWIPIAGALAIWLLGMNPIWVILAAAFGGYIYGNYIKPTE